MWSFGVLFPSASDPSLANLLHSSEYRKQLLFCSWVMITTRLWIKMVDLKLLNSVIAHGEQINDLYYS